MRRRRLLLTGTALILSILGYICSMALIQPSVASAHAYVIGSDPVDGSTVAKVPKEVHIYFNAPISPLSSAHVYFTQSGNYVNVEAAPSRVAPLNAQELIIPIKTPNGQFQGGYVVNWSAVANGDGHTTEGVIGFNVGFSGLPGFTGTPILGPSTSNSLGEIHTLDLTALLAILWEWLVFVALTAWIGILVMEQFVLIDGRRGPELLAQVRKHTFSLQRLCLTTLLFGESVALFLRATHLIKVQQIGTLPLVLSLSMITETNYGHIWLLRIVLIALIMGLLYWTRPSRKNKPISELVQSTGSSDLQSGEPTQESQATDTNQADDTGKLQEPVEVMPVLSLSSHRVAWLLFAGLLTLLFVLTGPSAQVLQPHFSAILFDWLRNVAQGVWFGSFAYLGYVLLPLLKSKNRDYDAETLVRLQQRLTPVLLVSISIQLLSLIFLSETSIHDPQQLITDPYGVTLLVQLIIIAIAVLLSAYILASVGRGGGGLHLQITTGIISMLGIGILLCSALMSFFAPPIVFPNRTYTNQLDIPTNAVSTQTKQIGPFSVILELLPGRITQSNTVIILIKDSNGQAVTDAQVRLTTNMQVMNMGTGHALITGGNPVYATTFDLHLAFNMSGSWTINVEIQRPNQQAVQGTFEVMLS